MKTAASFLILPALFVLTLNGCSEGFGSLGSSLLSSTGLVNQSQAEALLNAGEGLAKAAQGLTPEEEHYLGRSVSATILGKYSQLNSLAVNRYVAKVGQVLAAVSDRPDTFGGYHFAVLNTEEINALSAPDGFIFVTKGLIRLMPDEDALAAVLAHEIGHIVANDGVRAISQSHLTQALTILGKEAVNQTVAAKGNFVTSQLTSAFSDSVKDVADTLITKGYSRSQEYAADVYASKLLARAGYNSGALLVMVDQLAKVKAKGGMFETHPDPADRREELVGHIPANSMVTEDQRGRKTRFEKSLGRALS